MADHNFQPPSYITPSNWEHRSIRLASLACAISAISILVSLLGMYGQGNRLQVLEQHARETEIARDRLESQLTDTRKNLAARLVTTQRLLDWRTQQLRREQQEAASRLSEDQKQQITAVSGEVAGMKSEMSGVKTDVTGVKTEVAMTREELEETKAKLQHAIGDLGVQSGLIAHTRDELQALKMTGERTYYEFTLAKQQKKPTPVGTISLQLKKIDASHGRYTLNVVADDHTIEKRDRNLNEPLQFYSGRDRQLFEIVVNSMDKSKASGYLSAPKTAPVPPTVGTLKPSGN